MSHRTNQRPAPCATCKTPVAMGAGTLLGGNGAPWKVVCQSCLAFPAPAATPIRITMHGSDKIEVEPTGRLGGDRWNAYKSITDAHGVRAKKVGTIWHNYGDLQVAGELINALSAAGFSLEVSDDVRAGIAKAGKVADLDVGAAAERVAAVDAELARRGKSLFSFQRDGVGWLAARNGAILGDDMGLGKSLQALTSSPADAPILVICPAVAKGVWVREAANWRPDLRVTKISGRGSFRWPSPKEILICNYDILPEVVVKTPRVAQDGDKCAACTLAKELHTPLGRAALCHGFEQLEDDKVTETPAPFLASVVPGTVVILDEAHTVKNRGTKSKKVQRTERATAICKAAREATGRSWGLTATPILNRPPELWTLLTVLGLAQEAFAGNWFGFAKAMGGTQKTIRARGGKEIKVWEWTGLPTPLAGAAIKRIMLRRMKDDVLADLPPKTYKTIDVELADKSLQRDMDEVWADFGDEIGSAIREEREPAIPFDQISALRARLAAAKIPAMLEEVETYEDAEEPLVVFSSYRAPIEELGKREGWATIMGGTSPEERTRIENDFQAGKLKGVAATIKAGGVAITLTRAANVLFVDKDWTPALNAQAEDRCRRIGQNRPVQISELVAEHKLDQQVAELLLAKQNLINASVEKARVGKGEAVLNASQSAQKALLSLEGQHERIQAAQLVAAERDATLAALLARLATEEAAAAARDLADRTLTREQRFERTVSRAQAKQRDLDGANERRAARTEVEAWAQDGIQSLAAMDADFAFEQNGVGFSKDCVGVGHALARAVGGGLTDRAWQLCVAVCMRFKGQIGAPPAREEAA